MKYIIQILLLCFFCSSAHAVNSLPITGEHSVGSKSYFIIDKHRVEILTKDTNDFRRIAIQAFYPSSHSTECSNRVQSPCGNKVKSSNCLDRDILKSQVKYPIVILSPGFGGSYLMNMTLAEEIASQGYYVINVGHTFFNATPSFPDGIEIEIMSMDTLKPNTKGFMDESFRTRLNTYIKIQKEDIITVLNELNNMLDKDHLDAIDLENIACIGYSGGGATSADICTQDTRVKAGVNINGVLYGDAWKRSNHRPFLYINADYSKPKKAEIEMIGGLNMVDSLMNFYNGRKKQFSERSTNDFYELTLSKTTHHNFSDWALSDQSFCGKANPKKCLTNTYRYITLFLDKYLKGKTSSELNASIQTKDYYFEIIKQQPTKPKLH